MLEFDKDTDLGSQFDLRILSVDDITDDLPLQLGCRNYSFQKNLLWLHDGFLH